LYASPNIMWLTKEYLTVGACSTHGGDIVVRKPKGKRPFGRPKRRWEDNIAVNVTENMVGRCGLDVPGSG
jgi:hypothetical protein